MAEFDRFGSEFSQSWPQFADVGDEALRQKRRTANFGRIWASFGRAWADNHRSWPLLGYLGQLSDASSRTSAKSGPHSAKIAPSLAGVGPEFGSVRPTFGQLWSRSTEPTHSDGLLPISGNFPESTKCGLSSTSVSASALSANVLAAVGAASAEFRPTLVAFDRDLQRFRKSVNADQNWHGNEIWAELGRLGPISATFGATPAGIGQIVPEMLRSWVDVDRVRAVGVGGEPVGTQIWVWNVFEVGSVLVEFAP